jgi:hypothetical protein
MYRVVLQARCSSYTSKWHSSIVASASAAAAAACSYLTAKALSIVTAEIELEDHETGER